MHRLRKSAPWLAVAALVIGGVVVAQEVVGEGTPPDFADGERTVSLQTGGTERTGDGSADGEVGSESRAGKRSGTLTDEDWEAAERERERREGRDDDSDDDARGGQGGGQPAPAPVAPVPVPHYWDDDDWDDDWDDWDDWDDDDWDDDWDDWDDD